MQDQLVERRQIGRIVTDRILDQQNRLHPHPENIVIGIHPILDQFDDRQNQIGISMPTKNVINGGTVLLFNATVYIFRIVDQQHIGQIGMQGFELFRKMEHIQITDIEHADHQIEIVALLQHLHRLGRTAHARKRRGITQIQLHVFPVDLHLQTSVLFKCIGIVATTNQQNTSNATAHQVPVIDRTQGLCPWGNCMLYHS